MFRPNSGRRWLGGWLLIHFALICLIKSGQGLGADVWWLSHVALALGGAGLLLRSPGLVSAALIAVLLPHSIWLLDWTGGFLLGRFPLGVTAYLQGASAATWLATVHHFYLMPLLVTFALREQVFVARAYPFIWGLFGLLSLVGRFGLPPARNVNAAFAMVPSVDLPVVHWANGLSTWPFLLFLNAWMGLVMMLPAVCLFRRLVPEEPTLRVTADRSPSPT